MKKLTLLALALASCGLNAAVTNTSNPAIAIPDATCSGAVGDIGTGGITDSILFTELGTISDVNVAVEIDQTFRGDLQFHVNYNGVNVDLASDHGGADNDYYATFDDEGAALCSDAANCGTGSGVCDIANAVAACQPDAALSAFDSMNSDGILQWTLNVCDDAGGDLGTLQSWSVTLDGDNQLPVELLNLEIE